MKKNIFTFISILILMCAGVFFLEKYSLYPVNQVVSVKTKDKQVEDDSGNAYLRKDVSPTLADASQSELAGEVEKEFSPDLPIFLTQATTPLAVYLTEFLEQNEIGYLDTSRYPFSDDINSHITEYLQNQKYILVDNTNAEMWEVLGQRFDDVTPSKAVADLFGLGLGDDEDPGLVVVSSFYDAKTNSVKDMMIEVESGGSNQKTEKILEELLVYLEEQKRQFAEGESGLEQPQSVAVESGVSEDEVIPDPDVVFEDGVIEEEVIEDKPT